MLALKQFHTTCGAAESTGPCSWGNNATKLPVASSKMGQWQGRCNRITYLPIFEGRNKRAR